MRPASHAGSRIRRWRTGRRFKIVRYAIKIKDRTMKIRNLSVIIIIIFILVDSLYSINKRVIIYDPLHHHGTNFYNTLKSIYPDSARVIFDLDSTIFDSDALFIFLSNDTTEYILNSVEGDLLITYMTNGNHVYIYSEIGSQNITDVPFWNYIGIQFCAALPMVTHIDSIVGVPGTFTEGIVIPHEFDISHLPHIGSGCFSILEGIGSPLGFPIAYASETDSGYAVIDLFNKISYQSFLERVLFYFDLVPSSFIWEGPSGPIDNFILFQNFPNPFNSTTTISFQLFQTETVQLGLYNSLGEEIRLLINNQKLGPGFHRYNFDFLSLSSGIYYYRLQTGSKSQVKKLHLCK